MKAVNRDGELCSTPESRLLVQRQEEQKVWPGALSWDLRPGWHRARQGLTHLLLIIPQVVTIQFSLFSDQQIDLSQPIEEQGPFAAILHKMTEVIAQADQGELEVYNPKIIILSGLSDRHMKNLELISI